MTGTSSEGLTGLGRKGGSWIDVVCVGLDCGLCVLNLCIKLSGKSSQEVAVRDQERYLMAIIADGVTDISHSSWGDRMQNVGTITLHLFSLPFNTYLHNNEIQECLLLSQWE